MDYCNTNFPLTLSGVYATLQIRISLLLQYINNNKSHREDARPAVRPFSLVVSCIEPKERKTKSIRLAYLNRSMCRKVYNRRSIGGKEKEHAASRGKLKKSEVMRMIQSHIEPHDQAFQYPLNIPSTCLCVAASSQAICSVVPLPSVKSRRMEFGSSCRSRSGAYGHLNSARGNFLVKVCRW